MNSTATTQAASKVELIAKYVYKPNGFMHDEFKKRTPKEWETICKDGGFNPYTETFTPLKFVTSNLKVGNTLDHITAAVEAGIVDGDNWANQLFSTETDREGFLKALSTYDSMYRISDRWFRAIGELLFIYEEDEIITCAGIVSYMRDSIHEGSKRRLEIP